MPIWAQGLYTRDIGITHQAQIWADSYISRARMRPHVYTRTRIMRARGRAHAPARGGKSVVCSRIRYLVEGCSRIALFSPTHGYRPKYRSIQACIPYVGPYTLYRLYPRYRPICGYRLI